MTPKFRAHALTISGYYQTWPIVDEQGRKFYPIRAGYEIGDKCFLGKRINNHHGELALWELWEHVVGEEIYQMLGKTVKFPKTWFRDGRKLLEIRRC